MPPRVQMRLIRESLTGKEGSERLRILKEHFRALPGYWSGPYGQIRRWILDEIERSRGRADARHQESFAVPKEGDRQVGLIGAPNAGKSALLRALTGVQTKVADYPFATLKPVAALAWVNGAALQLVEVPGIVPGAGEDRGGGRALLGVARNTDYLLYLASLRDPAGALGEVLTELELAGIVKPAGLVLTWADLPEAEQRKGEFLVRYGGGEGGGGGGARGEGGLRWAACSSATGEGLDGVRAMLWSLAGLIRVWPRDEAERARRVVAADGAGRAADSAGLGVGRAGEARPFVLEPGATVADLARRIHKGLGAKLRLGRVWGPSARFPGQTVGPGHRLEDGDEVEVVVDR